MVGRALSRLLAVAGALLAALAVTLGAGAATAQAAPRATTPTSLTITGKGIAGPVIVQAADQPGIFRQLLSEVSWLATAKPQTSAPTADRLGPKFALTVLVKNSPTYAYDLYPAAKGGPRAHRAARQPNGKKVAAGWFYGRLTMSESLRISGVPLTAKPDVFSGGIGGGLSAGVLQGEVDPVAGVNRFLTQMRELVLLNGAVLVVILFGLAGISYLIRRRV
ncbi:MAG: hypothetical protein QOH97_2170 [Actinoplanes sp.]|jgi:hypothetical protein|nr:hypothetical protein [Actinoplanes sp.]